MSERIITEKQLREIMPYCPPDSAAAYAVELSRAMLAAEITTVTRAAAFLGQLAHESGCLRFMSEFGGGAKYEGRADLGNTTAGDGERYKGRGPLQLTGRANYRKYGDALGVPLVEHPELAATPGVGFRVAAKYWVDHGLNALADKLDWVGITRAINGGLNGYTLRVAFIQTALAILGRDTPLVGVTP
jgi:predicted chitinase